MIVSGNDALNFELNNESLNTENLFFKLGAGDSVSVVFLGGINGVRSWLQHAWWQTPLYGSNPGELEVSQNVIFPSPAQSWKDPDEADPGKLLGSKGQAKYAASILLKNDKGEYEEKVYFFPKSVWNGIVSVIQALRSEYSDDEDIGDKWLRISNSGKGTDRYSVTFMGKTWPEADDYEQKTNVEDFIKTYTYKEIVLMCREAGLPIDKALSEHGLDENGNKKS